MRKWVAARNQLALLFADTSMPGHIRKPHGPGSDAQPFSHFPNFQCLRISVSARLRETLAYIRNQWDGVQTFPQDDRGEIRSNSVMNLIRPIALNGKSAFFVDHDAGSRVWGHIASPIDPPKINNVEPFACLKATREANAAGHPRCRIDRPLT